MSILINMEMPNKKNGAVLIIYPDGKCAFEDGKTYQAVPVPPHGDLIDRRDAIIDANERAYDFWLSDDEVNATIQFLKEQLTIIPAEEGEA